MDKLMDKLDAQIVQVAKEITVKFIEMGKITPSNFGEVFPAVCAETARSIRAVVATTKDLSAEPGPKKV